MTEYCFPKWPAFSQKYVTASPLQRSCLFFKFIFRAELCGCSSPLLFFTYFFKYMYFPFSLQDIAKIKSWSCMLFFIMWAPKHRWIQHPSIIFCRVPGEAILWGLHPVGLSRRTSRRSRPGGAETPTSWPFLHLKLVTSTGKSRAFHSSSFTSPPKKIHLKVKSRGAV